MPTPQENRDVARLIAGRIRKDLVDRRGLRQAWERIDADVAAEIVSEWERLACEVLDARR